MKKTPLRRKSKSPVAKQKERIQALLREIVIKRDKGCILRHTRRCGGEVGKAVLQADHLVTRANSATYGDSRLVVCLCRPCHGGFKHWHKEQYDDLVRQILPEDRVKLWDLALKDMHRPHKVDWNIVEIALQAELKLLD